jgi:FG-GAP-like repeat/Secretion system C-terminal sorting domain
MKLISTTLMVFFTCSVSNLQAQFADNIYIENNTNNYARKIQTLDANRDGKKDILILNQGIVDDYLNLYLQDSSNHFQSTPFSLFNNVKCKYIKTAKIDNDNFDDIITVQHHHFELAWYKNEANGFSQKIIIKDTTDTASEIYVSDIDKDGNKDLLVLQHNKVVIYWQDNLNKFSEPQVIHSGTEFYSICLVDINNDGYEDVLAGSGGFEILLNNKNRSFALQPEHWGISLNFNIEAADIDNDGDQDIFTWETLQGIFCYFNDGTGLNFYRDTVYKSTDNFRSIQIVKSVEGLSYVATTVGQLRKIITITSYPQTGFREYLDHHIEPMGLVYIMMADDLNDDGIKDLIWADSKAGILYGESKVLGLKQAKIGNLSVYPNPSQGTFFVQNKGAKNLELSLVDIYGRTIQSLSLSPNSKESFSMLVSGIYVLQYLDENNTLQSEKVIIH